MKVINITYKYANCYLVQTLCGYLMIDAGWPDTLHQVLHLLRQKGVNAGDISHLIVSHFHPDHAGLVQNFKEYGTKLILHESQAPFVKKMNDFFKKNPEFNFKDIASAGNIVVSSAESRIFLKSIGIDGEIIRTPGHSDDSISLIIDGCCAFTGDLPELSLVEAYGDRTLKDSWDLIQGHGVKTIYPAHGGSYSL